VKLLNRSGHRDPVHVHVLGKTVPVFGKSVHALGAIDAHKTPCSTGVGQILPKSLLQDEMEVTPTDELYERIVQEIDPIDGIGEKTMN
jgi:hypothetical protein